MSLTQYLLDIIFPPVCLSCRRYISDGGAGSRRLCGSCGDKLAFTPGLLCPVCSRRIPEGERACHLDSQFILASPLKYANPAVRELIHALKYGGLRAAAEPLVSVLAEYLSASLKNHPNFAGNSIIIPIPLHPGKERERGFNQALIIAEGLKDRMENFQETPLVSGCLFKKESTGSQTEQKDCAAREENVRGSFGLRDMELISGRNVFLIDDVFTSGATMREAARILKSAGAKKIVAVTVARA